MTGQLHQQVGLGDVSGRNSCQDQTAVLEFLGHPHENIPLHSEGIPCVCLQPGNEIIAFTVARR